MYPLADTSKILFHAHSLNNQARGIYSCAVRISMTTEAQAQAYKLFAKTELGDAIAHIKELCALTGFDFAEVEALGKARRLEHQAEYEKRHPGVPWI